MELFVAGCHGGETPRHRTCAFVVDGRLALDAGALTSGLTLAEQAKLQAVLVSHAHLDHVRDLASVLDNRVQLGAPALQVYGPAPTMHALRTHFFNNQLWPDFTVLPRADAPAVVLHALTPGEITPVLDYEVQPIEVDHTVDCCGYVLQKGDTALGYSGDTGPTDELWRCFDRTPNLKLALVEVSFPNELRELARVTGHLTAETLAADLRKLQRPGELDVLLYHMKPVYQAQIERECAQLRGLSLLPSRLGDTFVL